MCKHVHNYISVIERDFTLSNGEITKLIVNFNAFSKLFENDTALVTTQHINAMIKQNIYDNIYMSILGEHIVSLHDKVDNLISMMNSKSKGKEKVAHSSIQPPPEIGDFKLKDFSDLEDFLEKKFKGGSLKPIKVDNFSKGENNYKKEFSDDINKISKKYARNYNGKEIFEWNIDGYMDRHIYTTVHRMLMYITICKTNKNSYKTIADMIAAGFTGQLNGWWDNYLEEWGMSPLKEKDYIHPEQKVAVKYNCWDCVDSFHKALLYENPNRKHSWFIKICSNVSY
ncbi:hypothetical protein H5410_004765 [Solanum commersonii]|uniref:DUF7746 domain-containing protein n=1 Tax=Solanum commersonii TaxID=4109 RepID=A0A9J6A5H4_SOLCO|nr:hypothetical protein H5410_004765 [Solanum commersonii]